MNTATRMNNFLQRMLKKSDVEDDGEIVKFDSKSQHVEGSPRSNKPNWIRKLEAYSPRKRDVSASVKSLSIPITPLKIGRRNDYKRRSVPEPLTVTNDSMTNAEMPDLEKIIHEFEKGFLSPTKQETKETMKSGRFVRQIVAAFEEKYKVYNDYKLQMEAKQFSDERDKTMGNVRTTRNSKPEESVSSMGTTYIINNLESKFSDDFDSCETKPELTPCRSNESINLATCSFAMDEELAVSTPVKKVPDSSSRLVKPKSTVLDKTITLEVPKASTSKNLVRSNSSMKRERQPKIIGAFLKKPIKVEDTSIDWIPITGKKLPRKKSFKRLLSVLTGKKSSDKSSKVYGSQGNLPDKTTREFHDSGYDEKSCSSSSLTSLISITELLLQQEYNEPEVDRKTGTTFQRAESSSSKKSIENVNLKTFQKAPVGEKKCSKPDDANDDVLSIEDDACSDFSKKLLLEEIPRSDVRLSLGPSFPQGPRVIDESSDDDSEIYSMISQDSLEEDSLESFPPVSPLPKHPFVSSKRNLQNNQSGGFEAEKEFNSNDYEKVELRRDFQSWKFPSSEIAYDIPRRYMSKSEPALVTIGSDPLFNNAQCGKIVYDVPKPEIRPRPRSSVYEDALSLKRRNANFASSSHVSGFYASPDQEEPHYATVKPRNTRIYPSKELMRSMGDLSVSKNHIYNCVSYSFGDVRNF